MRIVITLIIALCGFVPGYFLATPAIVVLTVIGTIIAIIMRPKREQEIGALVGILAWYAIGLSIGIMWGTHLFVSGTSLADLGLPDVMHYIFRK